MEDGKIKGKPKPNVEIYLQDIRRWEIEDEEPPTDPRAWAASMFGVFEKMDFHAGSIGRGTYFLGKKANTIFGALTVRERTTSTNARGGMR